MYFQRDYVLRMIEMMGEMMRRLGDMLDELDARGELDDVARRALGMPMQMLRTATPDTLQGMLDEPQRYLAAQLLLIDIRISERTQTNDDLLPLYTQSLLLFASLTDADYAIAACDQTERILRDWLFALPAAALTATAALLERASRLSPAEDALFAALEQDPGTCDALLSFYTRLDALPDAELRTGGLTRAEIAEGRAALKR